RMRRPELNVRFGVGGNEVGRDVNDGCRRRRNLQILQEDRTHPLVHQNAPMLWIVTKLDDIAMVVVALDQMRLRAAAHLPDQSPRVDRHERRISAESAAHVEGAPVNRVPSGRTLDRISGGDEWQKRPRPRRRREAPTKWPWS